MGGPSLYKQDKPMWDSLQSGIDSVSQQFQQQAQGLNPILQNAAQEIKGNASLLQNINPNFAAGAYQPDQYTSGILSQAEMTRRNNLNSQQQQFSQQFQNNPAMARVLGAQAGINSQLSANPLQLQAAIAQRGRQVDEQSQTNNAFASLFGLKNQAAQNTAQAAALPMQNQQNLLQILNSLATDKVNRTAALKA